MSTAIAVSSNAQQMNAGYLRNPVFDSFFLLGIPALAIGVGTLVNARPEVLLVIFAADMWLLGYHHVAATFTRLCFDSASFKERRALVLYLPIAVAATVLALVSIAGLWIIATIYLYWQWWHYTRQSEGLSKAYAGKNFGRETGNAVIARAAFYAVPVAGILSLSSRRPDEFVFLPVWTLPIPAWLGLASQAIALVLVLLWSVEQAKLWKRGKLAPTYVAYTLTHFLIYSLAYIFFENATQGWMVINIWHNTQYIAFVWMFNNRRFAAGVDTKHQLLSTLSQTRNWWMYILACLTVSTALYYCAGWTLSALAISNAAYLAAFYQIVNFHHYIVDSRIWKLRQPIVRQTVGLT